MGDSILRETEVCWKDYQYWMSSFKHGAKIPENKVEESNLTEVERMAIAEFMAEPIEIISDENEVVFEDERYEQKECARARRERSQWHKANERKRAWRKRFAKYAEQLTKPVSRSQAKKDKKVAKRMMQEYQRQLDLCWYEYELADYYESKKLGATFYDPLLYWGDPEGEEMDWEEYKVFKEVMENPPLSMEEVQGIEEFLHDTIEEQFVSDEGYAVEEYRKQKGYVNSKRRANRKHKRYERNGALVANRSKHNKRVINNVYLGYSGVWPGDVFHPTVRSRISTSRRRADKVAIRDGIFEMTLERQEACCNVA